MHLGLDAHAAEREGEGNATYIRNMVRGLLAITDQEPLGPGALKPR